MRPCSCYWRWSSRCSSASSRSAFARALRFSKCSMKSVSTPAQKPWQYRILVPSIVNGLTALNLPVHFSRWGWARMIELVSMVLATYAFRHYLDLFLKDRRVTSILAFFIFLILPFQFFYPRPYYANYWFDTPAILFFTLGLTFLYQRKWALYYVLVHRGDIEPGNDMFPDARLPVCCNRPGKTPEDRRSLRCPVRHLDGDQDRARPHLRRTIPVRMDSSGSMVNPPSRTMWTTSSFSPNRTTCRGSSGSWDFCGFPSFVITKTSATNSSSAACG